MRERSRPVTKLSQEVLGACVDNFELLVGEEEYFVGNKELAIDVLTLLDAIRYPIQSEFKLNLKTSDMNSEVTPPPVDDENDTSPANESHGVLYDTAISLLSSTT
eukprot:scaffold66649_cov34-Attheya_sp.AAC.2